MSRLDGPRPSDHGSHEQTLGKVLQTNLIDLKNLPMLPDGAIKALSDLHQHSPHSECLSHLESDPFLAGAILRLANSPLFRKSDEFDRLEPLLNQLSVRDLQNLILAAALRSLFRKLPLPRKQRSQVLWRHFFTTACAARTLNRHLDMGFHGEEFACGLFHDVGRLLFVLGAPAFCELADPLTFQETEVLLEHEQKFLGADHCALGEWYCYVNELPEELWHVARFHHRPDDANLNRGLVGLIAMADDLANHLQREKDWEHYQVQNNLGWRFLAPTCDEEITAEFLGKLPAVLEEIREQVGASFPYSVA